MKGRGPVPLGAFFAKVDEGMGNIGVVKNEVVVEVCKAKKGVYILDCRGGRPFGDIIKLDRIHSQLARFDNHAKIFYFVGGKLAFF